MLGLSAEGDADAEFAEALADGVGGEAEGAGDGEEEAEGAEDAEGDGGDLGGKEAERELGVPGT